MTPVCCSVSFVADDDQPALPDDTEQRFAANLRLLRERQGMSQVKLAQEMVARGWPWRQQTVTRLENGQRMIRFGEATALAEILDTPLERFTRPVSEAVEVEKIRAASARLRESYEAVADAVCHLLDEQRTAQRLRVLNDQVRGGDLVDVAMVELRGWMRECTVDKAILKGRRRFTELGEIRGGREGGAAGPAPENAREPMAASGDEAEIVGAPGRAGNT
jgi:transcriptional regulator with XRE-family HTH domain